MRSVRAHPGVVTVHPEHSIIAGLWRLADPKIALASLVPFCTGLALAAHGGHRVAPALAVSAFAAIFLVEVGKNAVNDLFDFRTDSAVRPEERSPYSGGKRVLVDHLLTGFDLVVIAWGAFVLAGAVGAAVAIATNPHLLLLGGAAALVSVLYAMPPVHLAYRGLGELAVFAVYGPGILLGSVLLAGGSVDLDAIALSITFGLLIAAVLLANEFPDERADRSVGKRTLVVRLGRSRAVGLIGFVNLAAFALPIALVVSGRAPYLLGTLLGAPVAVFAYVSFRRASSGPPVIAQTATLATFVVASTGVIAAAIAL